MITTLKSFAIANTGLGTPIVLIYLLTEKQVSNYCNTIEAGPSAATARGAATPEAATPRQPEPQQRRAGIEKYKQRNIIEARASAATTREIEAPKMPRAQKAQENYNTKRNRSGWRAEVVRNLRWRHFIIYCKWIYITNQRLYINKS
jgi:hypothetical protein